jgi:NAD(P)-dependent dehydrogenase (short-subunit alcohol dehydrogenase family)
VSVLEGKVALVTGGAGGLGSATCRLLAAHGASVVVADLNPAGEALAEEIGGSYFELDASSLESNLACVEAAHARHGGLDLVHLNAGVVSGCGIEDDFDPALYRRAMGVNLDGVVFGTHAVMPALRERGGGAIVATASLAGLMGIPFDPLYSANKHGVVGFTRAMGEQLTESGIRFNAICPGFSESPMIDPLREVLAASGLPVIPAERVAEAVLALMTNDSNGECWFIQSGREPGPFKFRRVPGPRGEGEGVAPDVETI